MTVQLSKDQFFLLSLKIDSLKDYFSLFSLKIDKSQECRETNQTIRLSMFDCVQLLQVQRFCI